jgi:hypothetical protein
LILLLAILNKWRGSRKSRSSQNDFSCFLFVLFAVFSTTRTPNMTPHSQSVKTAMSCATKPACHNLTATKTQTKTKKHTKHVKQAKPPQPHKEQTDFFMVVFVLFAEFATTKLQLLADAEFKTQTAVQPVGCCSDCRTVLLLQLIKNSSKQKNQQCNRHYEAKVACLGLSYYGCFKLLTLNIKLHRDAHYV